jgi:hypothetical protein
VLNATIDVCQTSLVACLHKGSDADVMICLLDVVIYSLPNRLCDSVLVSVSF